LSFGYEHDRPVLRDLSVEIPRGSLVGILGPNGSGKTTLLRLLGGVISPWHGQVMLDGSELRSMKRSALARRTAMVPQETHPAFDYTVLELATMGRYPHLDGFEIEGPDDLAIARQALRATGTLHLEHRPFHTLSGGEKQRVVIASALAQLSPRPGPSRAVTDVLLLDEPTASLDLAYQLEIRSILASLNRDRGLTIVISTHDLNLAAALCRTLILLDRGRILAAGNTASVLTAPLIRQLYAVEVEIAPHARAGHLMAIPVGPLKPAGASGATGPPLNKDAKAPTGG
jgi:iron complex transport system ATP-binding protein